MPVLDLALAIWCRWEMGLEKVGGFKVGRLIGAQGDRTADLESEAGAP